MVLVMNAIIVQKLVIQSRYYQMRISKKYSSLKSIWLVGMAGMRLVSVVRERQLGLSTGHWYCLSLFVLAILGLAKKLFVTLGV